MKRLEPCIICGNVFFVINRKNNRSYARQLTTDYLLCDIASFVERLSLILTGDLAHSGKNARASVNIFEVSTCDYILMI